MSLTVEVLVESLIVAASGAWFMSRFAYRIGLVDIPNIRSSHTLPTPRGGGIGLLMAYVFSAQSLSLPLLLWLPPTLLAIVSFFDDKLSLTPRIRLFFQFSTGLVCSGYLFFFSNYHSFNVSLNVIQNAFLVLIFSIVIVGTANFFNFMDGINGIAGITGAVAFALIGYFAGNVVQLPDISLSAYGISAACLGFLPLNIPRARVFMGDVGSILLGFVFSSYLALLVHSLTDFLVLAGFLSTFYIDALTTLYIRKRDGEQLSEAHRRHLYQLFTNQLHVPHWKVSFCYGAVQLLIGLLLLAVYPYGTSVVSVTVVILVALWIVVMRKVRQRVEAQQP